MRKLSLNLEDLAVESFATDEAVDSRGTIRGAQISQTTCAQVICDCETNGTECETQGCETYDCPVETQNRTCPASCTFFCSHSCPVNTCAYTCGDSCGCPTGVGYDTCGFC
jgi:hypothetical protein